MSAWRRTTGGSWEMDVPVGGPLIVFGDGYWFADWNDDVANLGQLPNLEAAKSAAVAWLRTKIQQALDAIAEET